MIFHRIEDTCSPFFQSFSEIYAVSFPIHEQRTPVQQDAAFRNPSYHLDVIAEGEKVNGFIAYWEFPDYIYIEHLAIHPDQRGQQTGSRMLDAFAGQHTKTILLEIDPLVDEISRKRYRFYEKLGYKENTYMHSHPPYREGFTPHSLLLLSLHAPINQSLFEQFTNDLAEVVMKF